ncbi:MAG: hypothetical protein C5B43_02325 [Verrucomicrobia bacterium]|nr:MAG: hypothetical protein C5B43_02325 [Verrucomicrobiota bacterium]
MNIDEALDIQIKKLSKGKTVLDLGGYRGRECALALQAGAKSAICVDDESYKSYDNWNDVSTFPQVEYVTRNFMEWYDPADIVIFKNVIYHQRNPWRTMEHIRKLTQEKLLLATSFVPGEESVWRVYRPFEGHPVSWTVAWRPTLNGLQTLLEATGFKNIKWLVTNDQGSCALTAEPGELPIGFEKRN